MNADIYQPTRTRCNTMFVEYSTKPSQHIAVIGFECEGGGEITMYFNTPDELRQHATAMQLLAEALEEEQSK